MILVCTDIGGEEFIVDAKDARELVPCLDFFVSTALADPTTALMHYRSALLPLRGTLPESTQNAWVLILKDHGRILAEIPALEAAYANEVVDPENVTVEDMAEIAQAA